MPDMTLVLITAGAVVAGLLAIAVATLGRIKSAARLLLTERLDSLHRDQDRIERSIRDEIAKDREERGTSAKQLREELRAGAKDSTDSTGRMLESFGVRLDALTSGVDRRLASLQTTVDERLGGFQQSQSEQADQTRVALGNLGTILRTEVADLVRQLGESFLAQLRDVSSVQKTQFESFEGQLAKLSRSTEERLDQLRGTVDERLKTLQADNERRLDQMRTTVEEKLEGTLERRLGDSFKLVSERLEAVQRGLGEMQTLASGVGDLKKVLGNVKVRGTWGEIQLGSLLQQMLAPDQYVANAITRPGSSDRVEFAVKLPGKDDGDSGEVLLPIDAKFPMEDYRRLCDASERGDAEGVEESRRQLEARIRSCAREIRDKYVNPPCTTDFAFMFLPTEALFAEIVQRPGLVEQLQRDFKVSVAGPTTLAALLNSLQMGFQSLAIQKRSSEVWEVLGAVKTEFGKFGVVLQKVDKKLQEASNTLQDVGVRSRAIERRLRVVQELPSIEATRLLSAGELPQSDVEQGLP